VCESALRSLRPPPPRTFISSWLIWEDGLSSQEISFQNIPSTTTPVLYRRMDIRRCSRGGLPIAGYSHLCQLYSQHAQAGRYTANETRKSCKQSVKLKLLLMTLYQRNSEVVNQVFATARFFFRITFSYSIRKRLNIFCPSYVSCAINLCRWIYVGIITRMGTVKNTTVGKWQAGRYLKLTFKLFRMFFWIKNV
jgi:hypothetical protein